MVSNILNDTKRLGKVQFAAKGTERSKQLSCKANVGHTDGKCETQSLYDSRACFPNCSSLA
jgi:hypothetical protein